MDYICFKSRNDVHVHIDKSNIIKNAPVIANILNLEGKFNDKPLIEDNCYLLMNCLHHKSIILIFKFVLCESVEEKESNEECKLETMDYMKTMTYDLFCEAQEFCEPYCVFIPSYYWALSRRQPQNKEEDIFMEYEFFEFILDFSNTQVYKDLNYKLNDKYISKEWVLINQKTLSYNNRYGHEQYVSDIPRIILLTLRRKIRTDKTSNVNTC